MSLCFIGEGPDAEMTTDKWSRPKMPQIDAEKDDLTFQQLDIDYFAGL